MHTLLLDLHCHSCNSDGSETVAEVARQVRAAQLELFCLTDHDTLSGSDEVAAALPDIKVLRGLELTTQAHQRTVHLLVYGVGDNSQALELKLAELRQLRRQRIFEICERLTRWDIHLDAAAIVAESGHGTAGRPHVARALVKAGVCKTVREAFDRFLNDRGPATLPSPRLSVEEGLALALATGAQVSLAHPHLLGQPDYVKACCRAWQAIGLGGLEAHYGAYTDRQKHLWTELADSLGLVVTAGSDFHGVAVVPDIRAPGVQLDEARAQALLAWLPPPASRPVHVAG